MKFFQLHGYREMTCSFSKQDGGLALFLCPELLVAVPQANGCPERTVSCNSGGSGLVSSSPRGPRKVIALEIKTRDQRFGLSPATDSPCDLPSSPALSSSSSGLRTGEGLTVPVAPMAVIPWVHSTSLSGQPGVTVMRCPVGFHSLSHFRGSRGWGTPPAWRCSVNLPVNPGTRFNEWTFVLFLFLCFILFYFCRFLSLSITQEHRGVPRLLCLSPIG